jgi:UMF1 family MFS transporter
MLFDVAQQPYATLGLTFVFGPYFAAVAAGVFQGQGATPEAAGAQAQSLWGTAQTMAGLAVALTAPLLGAYADASGRKTPWIAASRSSTWPAPGACGGSTPTAPTFTPSFSCSGPLRGRRGCAQHQQRPAPSLAPAARIGRISGTGAALGYWGGVLSLALMLLLLAENEAGTTLLGNPPAFGLDPASREGTRSVGPVIAIWFVAFIIPFLVWTRDPPAPARRPPLREVWADLRTTLRDVLRRPSLGSFLLGSMLYRDGLGAIYSFGGIYATLVLGWDVIRIGVFGIVAAIAAAVLTWVGASWTSASAPSP